ncbi:eCIS core domain-containing protein [Propionibacteriaceae bacterium Y2011]|uniref:eCIS core domain-containing protein n=1 Tax=Microlunatus sp. Y2014 TaxID=3418488 RepID=UPI003B4D4E5F
MTTRAAEQAWRKSVLARPLETPQPLPAAFEPLARRLTGRAGTRFTTGVATRTALAAAGAVGATTGSVVHLPRRPTTADTAVLSHELAHLRTTVGRPRFLRPGAGAAADSEEHRAVTTATAALAPPVPAGRSPEPSRAMPAAPAVHDHVRSHTMSSPTPAGLGSTRAARAVSDLPVTGLAGAARAVQGEVTRAVAAATAPPLVARRVGVEEVETTAVDPEAPEPGVAVGTAESAPLDVDALVDALEVRLLRDLERRGSRFEGVF